MGDVRSDYLMQLAAPLIANGAQVYVKWTCPGCGQRVVADEPNTFHTGGYKHAECGVLYTGDLFGMLVIAGAFGSST